MSEARYCSCGQLLSPRVTADEAETLDGVAVKFRRNSDYIVCLGCVSFHRVVDLRAEDLRITAQRELSLLNQAY